MVLERAEFIVKDGMADDLLAVLREKALPLTRTYTGCVSFKAMRGVENPNTIMFLAEWISVEAHHLSRAEPSHAEFRRLLMPYAAGASPTVHFTEI